MRNKQLRERELDLNDLFWKLMEQWKGIVLCGLILALLLSSAIIIKNRRASKETAEADPEISNVLSLYADYVDKREQYNNNFFNDVDLNDCVTVTCLYEYTPTEKTFDGNYEAVLAPLNNLYTLMISDDTFRAEMIAELQKYWPKISSNTLGNIMNSTAVHSVVWGPGTITINITIPKGGDPQDVQAALTKSVYAYHDRIASAVPQENTIRFLSFAFKQTDYTTELNARNSRYNLVSSGLSQYKSAYNNLDKNGQNLVDQAKKKCGNVKDPAVYEEFLQKEANKSGESIRSILMKYGVLGLIAGMLLYAFLYLCFILIARRTRTEAEFEAVTGIRNFGGIYEYPYKNFILRFLHSRMIYSFRTKTGKDMARISSDIASKLEFSGRNTCTLITLGKLSERAKAINEEQVRLMKDKGITLETLDMEMGPGTVEDSAISGLGSVVIELIGNRTRWTDLVQLYSKLGEYDIDIIGSQFIDA